MKKKSDKYKARTKKAVEFSFGLRTFFIGFYFFDVWPAGLYQMTNFNYKTVHPRKSRAYLSLVYCYLTLAVTLLEVGILYWICARVYIPRMPTEEELINLNKSISNKAKVIEEIEKAKAEKDKEEEKLGEKPKEKEESEKEEEKEEDNLDLSSVESSESDEFNPNIRRFNQVVQNAMAVEEVYIMGIKMTQENFHMTENMKLLKEQRDREERELLERLRKDYEKRKRIKRNLKRLRRALKRYEKFKEKKTVVQKKDIKKFFNTQINIFGAKKQNISKDVEKEIIDKTIRQGGTLRENKLETSLNDGLLRIPDSIKKSDPEESKKKNLNKSKTSLNPNNQSEGEKLLNLTEKSKARKADLVNKSIEQIVEEEAEEKETEIFFMGDKNTLDEWFLEVVTSDILVENLNVPFVKYYHLLFILRYMLIQMILVGGQSFGYVQCILLLIIQGSFLFMIIRTQRKHGLYENNFLKVYNYIQESSLFLFLVMALLLSIFAYRERDPNEYDRFIGYGDPVAGSFGFTLEFIAVISVIIAFLTEVFSMLIMIFGIIVFVFKFFKAHYRKIFCFCCYIRDVRKKKREEEEKKKQEQEEIEEKKRVYRKMADMLKKEEKLMMIEVNNTPFGNLVHRAANANNQRGEALNPMRVSEDEGLDNAE